MNRYIIPALLLVLLVGCDDKKPPPQPQPGPGPRPQPTSSIWQIGPIINGTNYSVGMPPTLDAANGMNFPTCPGHVDYVTKASGPIAGTMRLAYRVEGAQVAPRQGSTATVSLYFQRRGDDWSGGMAHYRWYHAGNAIVDGDHVLEASLEDSTIWGSAMGQQDAGAFALAKADAWQVGFVFGDPKPGATGHGVCGAGRFTVVGFTP